MTHTDTLMTHSLSLILTTMAALALALPGDSLRAETASDPIARALAHPDRPEGESSDDETRRPAEVLRFAGLQQGMAVLELEASGGWYTEILSRAVGESGRVVMQNPPAFESFTGDKDNQRADRLANVTLSTTNFDELESADASIDLVTWILGPHELWFAPGGQSLGDPDKAMSEIARVLKPGGRFLAIDHQASAEAGPETGGSLHRIHSQLIQDMAAAVGLQLIDTSDLFANENDPLTNSAFDPSIRGQTEKFVLLMQK